MSALDTQAAVSAEQRSVNSSIVLNGTTFLSRNGLVREFQTDPVTC